MRHTSVSELHPTIRRAIILAAISAIMVLSIGFAPIPTLFYVLSAGCIALCITWATDARPVLRFASNPILLAPIVPVVVSFLVRGTALAWAAVPVLAIVTAGAAWIIAVNVSANMPAATTTPTQAVDELPSITSTDVALPTTQEKPTVADEDSSATAA